ncbi:MAG: PQQ-binding-like beta-propeller repeat protein [Pirellulaceae bacterium]
MVQREQCTWRAPMPGQGGATPAVWGDSMFVTSADGDDLVLFVSTLATVPSRWRRTVTSGNQDACRRRQLGSPSPSTDGQHVWVFFSTGVLACYDFQGEEQWKFDVGEPLREDRHSIRHGIHAVVGRQLSLSTTDPRCAGQGDDTRSGQVIKLDKLSGETVWVQERITQAGFECKQSYASPVLYDDGQQRFVIAHGAGLHDRPLA